MSHAQQVFQMVGMSVLYPSWTTCQGPQRTKCRSVVRDPKASRGSLITLLQVVMPFAPNSKNAPSSKARSP